MVAWFLRYKACVAIRTTLVYMMCLIFCTQYFCRIFKAATFCLAKLTVPLYMLDSPDRDGEQ